eukprot:GEZU01025281.1.p1 GENE.GEZU01025281.1~~GEZU01025281.1.p1  ORF type:complete len:138 (+),score=6.47 GEZU01025281.1:214-627(+)
MMRWDKDFHLRHGEAGVTREEFAHAPISYSSVHGVEAHAQVRVAALGIKVVVDAQVVSLSPQRSSFSVVRDDAALLARGGDAHGSSVGGIREREHEALGIREINVAAGGPRDGRVAAKDESIMRLDHTVEFTNEIYL